MKILDIPQSGKRGLYVSMGGRYGQVSRMLVIPSNPRTEAQVGVRAALRKATVRWRGLSEVQRSAWRATARTKNTVPRLGQSGPLTGSQLFAKINCSLATLGLDQVTAPPPSPQFPDNPVGTLVITNEGGVVSLKLGCPSAAAPNTIVRATAPCSQGLEKSNNYRVLGVLPTPAQGSCDITSLYTARHGIPAVGDKVFVEVNQNVNGWEDYPVSTWAIVPAST